MEPWFDNREAGKTENRKDGLDWMGCCGVDCAACPDFISAKCPGCRKSVWPDDDPCPPVGCCTRRQIPCCGACADFPCGMMEEFFAESESHRAAGERMHRWHAEER